MNNLSCVCEWQLSTLSRAICDWLGFPKQVFPDTATQEQVFNAVAQEPLERFLGGCHVLLFAYGPTSSGKTFTMQGSREDPGVFPRALDRLFRMLGPNLSETVTLRPDCFDGVVNVSVKEKMDLVQQRDALLAEQRAGEVADLSTFFQQESSGTATASSSLCDSSEGMEGASVWLSSYEIYKESVHDLFWPHQSGKRPVLKVGEDSLRRSFVKGLKEIPVRTADEAYALLCLARRNLSVAETRLNRSSSRSHCVFNVRLLRLNDGGAPSVTWLTLCDLAGSENPSKTGNVGCRLREAGRINGSLLVLGRCLEALRPGKENLVAPFRESKLTKVMQAFFSKGSSVSLVVTVNPSPSMLEESLNALRFSAVACEVVPSKPDSRQTKCKEQVRRLTQVWEGSPPSSLSGGDFGVYDVEELFETVDSLSRDLKVAVREADRYKEKAERLERFVAVMEENERLVEEATEKAMAEKLEYARTFARLEMYHEAKTGDYLDLRRQLEEAQDQLERLKTARRRNAEGHDVEEIRAELEAARTGRDAALAERDAALAERDASLQEKLEALEKLRLCESEIESKTKFHSAEVSELQQRLCQLEEQAAKVESLKLELQDCHLALESANLDVSRARNLLENEVASRERLTAEAHRSEQDITELKDKCSFLQESLTNLMSEKEEELCKLRSNAELVELELRDQLTAANTESEELRKLHGDAARNLQVAEEEAQKREGVLRTKLDFLARECQDLKEKAEEVTTLRKQLAEAEASEQLLRSYLETLKNSSAVAEEARVAAEERAEEAEKKLCALRSQLSETKEDENVPRRRGRARKTETRLQEQASSQEGDKEDDSVTSQRMTRAKYRKATLTGAVSILGHSFRRSSAVIGSVLGTSMGSTLLHMFCL